MQIKKPFTFLALGLSLLISVQALANSKAGNSRQLEVAEDFNFVTHKVYEIDVSVTNDLEEGAAGLMVKFYWIPQTGNEQEAVGQKSLIGVGRTNEQGWLSKTMELPAHYKKIVVEVGMVAKENSRVVNLSETGYVAVPF